MLESNQRKVKDITMKKTGFLLVTLLLALSMVLGGCEKMDSSVPAGMQLASSEDADYLFYVPEGWRVNPHFTLLPIFLLEMPPAYLLQHLA